MQVQQEAIERAMRLLTAAKAQFKIIAQDGSEFGELAVATAKVRKRTSYKSSGYIDAIKSLQAGDVIDLKMPDNCVDLSKWQSAVCSIAFDHFGSGNYITSKTEENTVQILRIA